MTRYEYKVVPAPGKAAKVKGVKSPEGRFAHSIEAVLNEMAADGWEFQRAELDPDNIHLPGVYVHRIITGQHEKRIEQRTTRKREEA